MTVGELLAYCQPMYSNWDNELCAQLTRRFNLELETKVGDLTRGMRIKAALLCSLAYRPQLLVLDEPFGGLDPLVRDELIQGMLELSEQENWTVFVASHDIDEVKRLADSIGLLDRGRLRLHESVDSLQSRFRLIEVTVEDDSRLTDEVPGTWLSVEKAAHMIRFVHTDYSKETSVEQVKSKVPGFQQMTSRAMSLKDIFIALCRSYRIQSD